MLLQKQRDANICLTGLWLCRDYVVGGLVPRPDGLFSGSKRIARAKRRRGDQ